MRWFIESSKADTRNRTEGDPGMRKVPPKMTSEKESRVQ